MESGNDLDGPYSSATAQTRAPQKRSRVLLSCAPCRTSKLKCDRRTPCAQCQRRGAEDQCQYAPKPEKRKPTKTMAARLRRLEGMVRGMLDADGNPILQPDQQLADRKQDPGVAPQQLEGHVVKGHNCVTSYVGATHCMAMLEDIEDLKNYFEDSEDEDADSPPEGLDGPEILLYSRGAPRNREELLAQLPEKLVADRLITRYFQSTSPSQHVIHRPTFTRQYARFWQDPNEPNLHWIAQLFMILALGTHFNSFQAPNEVQGDSPIPTPDRIKLYRSCAGWALLWGKFAQPNPMTLPAFMLFVESHFLFSRAAQMNCYILSGVLVRLMFKMGLHREPSRLANLTPFEGEMRRRMWNMALQVETIVAFHMGLPCMIQTLETDTALPRNLNDEDFDEDTKELPPGRPDSDWTSMTYPIHKTKFVRVFGQIAQQMHALNPPSYSEVLRLDNLLQETWRAVPSFMIVRPLDECVGDPPTLLIQRFGLAALYNKSRCVLHRRYVAEPTPRREHDYSRQQCLQGALTLMRYQVIVWEACKPGHILAHHGWFVSSLSVHDFLLAAVVLYLVVQNEHYGDPSNGLDWTNGQEPVPTKQELKDMIRRSYEIWSDVAETTTEVRRTADTLALMLARLGTPVDRYASVADPSLAGAVPQTAQSSNDSMTSSVMPQSSVSNIGASMSDPFSSMSLGGLISGSGQTPFSLAQTTGVTSMDQMAFPGMTSTDSAPVDAFGFDPSWISTDNMDWRFLDISLAHSHTAGSNTNGPGPVWMERALSAEDLGPGNSDFWSTTPGQHGMSR